MNQVIDVAALESAKNQAYTERNQLVEALAELAYAWDRDAAWLAEHSGDAEGWDPEWRMIVFIDLGTGQMSWHIHVSEIPNFTFLPVRHDRPWDGHTTEEKYQRLLRVDWRKVVSSKG